MEIKSKRQGDFIFMVYKRAHTVVKIWEKRGGERVYYRRVLFSGRALIQDLQYVGREYCFFILYIAGSYKKFGPNHGKALLYTKHLFYILKYDQGHYY